MTYVRWPEGRRSSIQILGDILRLLRLGDAGKTEIMYTVNMSYSQRERYMNLILELGLAEIDKKEIRHVSYRVTKKGLDVLTQIDAMQEMLHMEDMPQIMTSPEVIKNVKNDANQYLTN